VSTDEEHSRDPDALTRATHAILPFVERTGLRIDRADRGHVKVTMPLGPNTNHVGTMYAGALFTLAEIPGGTMSAASFDPSRFVPIVKDLRITFLKPAVTDVSVEVRLRDEEIDAVLARAEADGKADYGWESELLDANGVVVARSENLYQIRSRDLPMPPASR
jgi:acyl-coenzyme A thioesterase PaaI-like protein